MPYRRNYEVVRQFHCGLCGGSHSCKLNFSEAYVDDQMIMVKANKIGEGCPQWFWQPVTKVRFVQAAKRLGLEHQIKRLGLQ